MALVEEVIEPLKYQTLALKVPIHCEGCKRKVKRVLQSIDGVYKIAFDAQQHKVTITGNVDAETLIKKLLKNGKNAELWPEIKPPNPNPKSKKKKKSKSSQKPPESTENPESNPSAATGDDETPEDNTELDSSKSDDSDEEPNNPSPPPDNPPLPTHPPNGGGGGGGGGKKKKKKKKKPHAPAPTAAGGGGDSKGPEITVVSSPHPPPFSPPRPRTYHVPPPQPVLSYSTASYFPATHYIPSSATATASASASASYYAMMEPALDPAPREDSYSLFSEENANACHVM